MKKILFLTLITLSLISFASEKEAKKKKSVSAIELKKAEISDLFSYPARIVASKQSTVLSESDGQLDKLNISLGQIVKKGQVLGIIKHSDPVFKYNDFKVISPLDGHVAGIYFQEGMKLQKGEKLFLIVNIDQIKATTELPFSEHKFLKIGMTGELKVNGSLPEKIYQATITGLSPVVDSSTGTSTAELTILENKLDKTQGPAPGTFGLFTVKTNVHEGFELPYKAIGFKGKKSLVAIVKDNTYQRKEVTLGAKREDKVEVTQGLTEGETVVLRTSGFIAEGEEVEVQK